MAERRAAPAALSRFTYDSPYPDALSQCADPGLPLMREPLEPLWGVDVRYDGKRVVDLETAHHFALNEERHREQCKAYRRAMETQFGDAYRDAMTAIRGFRKRAAR